MQSEVNQKVFTIAEANAALPLVRAICTDLAQLSQEVLDRRQRLAVLSANRPGMRDVYSEELVQIEEELERDQLRLREYVEELIALGVEPKDPLQGLVDFPSMKDGRLVYLCWKLGEAEVGFWHEVEAGFVGRQAIKRTMADAGQN
ncbi:MAG: DUF2203 domain-containing protein [Planctomycetia bacterium]|nr:DUF2203 domain-containing protein [Planctomycetia bacterium]